jgi:hypothetical protein
MRRQLLGIIAAVLIVVGASGILAGGGSSSQTGLIASSAVRAGLVLGALWLAFPQIVELSARFPPWLVGVFLLCCLVVAIRPRSATLIVPLLAVLLVMHFLGWLFRPPNRPRRH